MPSLTIGLLAASVLYIGVMASRGAFTKNNSRMRAFYGLGPNESFDSYWPNGCVWMREVSAQEKVGLGVATLVLLPLGMYAVPTVETFCLALTEDGVFVLKDQAETANQGVLRFSASDIAKLEVVKEGNGTAAVGLGKTEPADAVTLTLKSGKNLWIQVPRSARQSLERKL